MHKEYGLSGRFTWSNQSLPAMNNGQVDVRRTEKREKGEHRVGVALDFSMPTVGTAYVLEVYVRPIRHV